MFTDVYCLASAGPQRQVFIDGVVGGRESTLIISMHRWSKLFIPTLREAPADAEVASHKFLLRSGYIRQLGAGIYNYLFLGQRSLNKIIGIVREEMDRIGQEFYLPALLPKEPWEQSGRWTGMGDNMFRLKDRKGAELCLGMTHEEIMTSIARNELRSYKQLPQIWYQIQTKFRDEPRPKSGLLRVRQFTMKDSYSFDIDKAGLDKSFELHDAVYRKIFTRCGLKFVAVEADSGSMGGSQSQEFMVYTDAGEDLIASCPVCGYAANTEKATSVLADIQDASNLKSFPQEIATPDMKSIEDVSDFLNIPTTNIIKLLAFMAHENTAKAKFMHPLAVLLRGDHQLNEAKLTAALGVMDFRPMTDGELKNYFGVSGGFLGPRNLPKAEVVEFERHAHPKSGPLEPDIFTMIAANWPSELMRPGESRMRAPQVRIIADLSLQDRKEMVAGANKVDTHLLHMTPQRDFLVHTWADIRTVNEGEGCPKEGCMGKLVVGKAVEIGHIFKLGYKYSEAMGARVLDVNGKEVTPIMGSYGIGIERILTAAIEQSNDKNGFWLPASIAPFTVVVTVTNVGDALLRETGEKLARELEAAGLDVLLDDRDERAGVKFKDADLVGIPYRINVGKKAAAGQVELVTRATATSVEVTLNEVVALVKERVEEDALVAEVPA
jgi:prolyl-tRNA synthetase